MSQVSQDILASSFHMKENLLAMSGGPFTSKQGVHYKFDTRVGSQIGVSFGTPFSNYYPTEVMTGHSEKGLPVRGDHKTPLGYYREWSTTISDVPTVSKYHLLSFIERTDTSYIGVRRNSNNFFSPSFGGDVENARNKATTSAIANLQSDAAQLGSDLAEAVRMNDFVAQTAGTAAKLVLDFRRGNWKAIAEDLGFNQGLSRGTRTVSRRYLELIYGVVPLFQSAHDTANLLFNKSKTKPLIVKSKGNGKSSATYEYDDSGYHWVEESESSVKARISARVTCPFITSASELGIINPASIAWELVPFSFVVDWFIPVGNFLTAWSSMAGMSFELGSVTTKISGRTKAKYMGQSYDNGFDGVEIISKGSFESLFVKFRRDVFASAPLPSLYYKENPFSTTHVINALALMRQLY